jgi:hypothetical protein
MVKVSTSLKMIGMKLRGEKQSRQLKRLKGRRGTGMVSLTLVPNLHSLNLVFSRQ